MKCIILAAGYATRLYPLTENFPKPLLTIRNKTILDWLIDDIEESKKVDEYIVISNNKFIDYFNDWLTNKKMNNITIIDDGSTENDNRLGAVADILLAIKKRKLNDDILVIAGDNVLDFSLKHFINYFEEKKHSSIMRYYEENLEKIKKSACVIFDENDKILEMNEKPLEPKSHWCVPPFYIYKKEDLKLIKKAITNGCNKDAPGSLVNWLYNKIDMYVMEMPGKRYDIGTVEGYNHINEIYKGFNK